MVKKNGQTRMAELLISAILVVALCITEICFLTKEAKAVGKTQDKAVTASKERFVDSDLIVSMYEDGADTLTNSSDADETNTIKNATKAPSQPMRGKIVACKSKSKGSVKLKWKIFMPTNLPNLSVEFARFAFIRNYCVDFYNRVVLNIKALSAVITDFVAVQITDFTFSATYALPVV